MSINKSEVLECIKESEEVKLEENVLSVEEQMGMMFGSCTEDTETPVRRGCRKRKRNMSAIIRAPESSDEESVSFHKKEEIRTKTLHLQPLKGSIKCKHCSFYFPSGKSLRNHMAYHGAEELSSFVKNAPTNENEAVRFLQEKNVLPSRRVCPNGHNMALYFFEGVEWRCKACKTKIRMRNGNWFEGKRMPLMSHLCYMKAWCDEVKRLSWWEKKLDMLDWRSSGWRNILREVCVVDLSKFNGSKIGGVDKIVEVDKSFFFKTNQSGDEQWVFGGICRESNESFVVQSPDRSIISLINEILIHVKDGTTLYSNSWRSHCMNSVEHKEFHHLKAKYFVSHKFHFVDLESGSSNVDIKERIWGSDRWRKEEFRGKIRYHLESYLVEFLWGLSHRNEDIFEAILKSIASNWPPEEVAPAQVSGEVS